MAFAGDGSRLAAVHWNGTLDTWDATAARPVVDAYDTGYLGRARLAFLDDSDTLIIQNGYSPQRFDLFDTETGAVPSSMGLVFPTYAGFREEHLGGPPFDITYSAFAVSPDGASWRRRP